MGGARLLDLPQHDFSAHVHAVISLGHWLRAATAGLSLSTHPHTPLFFGSELSVFGRDLGASVPSSTPNPWHVYCLSLLPSQGCWWGHAMPLYV